MSFNASNPAVKRILKELKEVHNDPSEDFLAEALEDDIFEWLFVMRGPRDTPFEGGIYLGRILLPAEYPLKPPSFMLLTPSGRFETQVKICLSISAHHPEEWQPSWSIASALTALVAFLPTPGNGALGSLDYTSEERSALAVMSRAAPPNYGSPAKREIIQSLHRRMLERTSPPPAAALTPAATEQVATESADGELDTSEAARSGEAEPLLASTSAPEDEPESPRTRSLRMIMHQKNLLANTNISNDPEHFRVRGFPSDFTLRMLTLMLSIAIIAILAKKIALFVFDIDLGELY